jgi:hypothetical protein
MKLTLTIVSLCVAFTASAHDFWIEPSTFTPREAQLVTLQLRVGHFDHGEVVLRNSAKIEQFVTISGSATTPIAGVDGRDPAGYIRWSGERPGIVAYEGRPNTATLTPETFRRYVREERLSRPARMPKGEVRDHFSRSARLLFRDGSATWRKPAGLTLEILPESDPWRETTLRVRLLFEGAPLASAPVTAVDRADAHHEIHARTDAEGRASFVLNGPGPWLVKTVHAKRIGDDEYRSWWGSLVFAR